MVLKCYYDRNYMVMDKKHLYFLSNTFSLSGIICTVSCDFYIKLKAKIDKFKTRNSTKGK